MDPQPAPPPTLPCKLRVSPLVLLLALAACAAPVGRAAPSPRTTAEPASPNPVLPGDFPDPSVIRVGGEYFAAATSSEWGPPFPLLRSADLRSWRPAGAVLPTPPAWAAGSYWAPEISADGGRFQVYYTARRRQGPLCVAVASADRPDGPYQDHGPLVCQEAGAIDGVTARDEAGVRYLIWKEDGNSAGRPTPLFAQPLDPAGTALIGERRELLRNDAPWEGALIEGPFVLRRGGWFYLFYSGNGCCGAGCSYALGVARARHLLGPWEKHPRNPILAGNGAWRCPGHGSVVDDGAGRTLLLYHAYARRGGEYTGRQGLLDEVRWDAAGWPVINEGRGPSGAARPNPAPLFDDFAADPERGGWQWPIAARPRLRWERGALQLAPGDGAAVAPLLGAVLGRPAPAADYTATTLVDLGRMRPQDAAGLAVVGDADNAIGVSARGGQVLLWRRDQGAQRALAALPAAAPRLHLRLQARDGSRFWFAFSVDGQVFTALGGEQRGEGLAPWDRGLRVSLTAGGGGGRFLWLRLSAG